MSTTVNVKEQVGPAVVLQITVVVPFGKKEPEGGAQLTVPQAPVVLGALKLTFAPHWFKSFDRVIFAGQVIVHAAIVTVMLNEQLFEFFEASVTEQVTVVVPCGKQEPEAGLQTGAPTPGQLSGISAAET